MALRVELVLVSEVDRPQRTPETRIQQIHLEQTVRSGAGTNDSWWGTVGQAFVRLQLSIRSLACCLTASLRQKQ